MLRISIPETEYYDGKTETFLTCKARVLKLEHSLRAISRWESRWMKPFLGNEVKTAEEIYHYIQCMSLSDDVDLFTVKNLTQDTLDEISKYIQSTMTATKLPLNKEKPKTNREVLTSELIYYWMVSFNIPFECQEWHINRLLTLINVCDLKNNPPKKSNPKEILSRNASINAARKKAMKTSG